MTEREIPVPDHRAVARLAGEDGNAFAIMGRATAAMRRAGYSPDLIKQYQVEATSGDYDNLLATTMDYVDDLAQDDREEEDDDDDDF